MVILKTSLIFVFLILIFFLSAQNLEEFKTEIIHFYSSIKTYEAEFEQHNFWSGANLAKQSAGTLYFNEEKLILSYKEPDNQMLIVEENFVIMYNPNSKQAILSGEMDIPLRPADIVEHFWNQAKEMIAETENDTLLITLTTEQKEQIELVFSENLLLRLQILDEDKNEVRYNFHTIRINQSLAKEILEFEIPDDVHFIDTRNR